MKEDTIIIAAIVGFASSAITLFLTSMIDYLKAKLTYKLDMKKLVFQRKTDVSERAMSWYQESIDCFSTMKLAYQELDGSSNPIIWAKLIQSTNQANKLYAEANVRLSPLYLYFDFRKIEEKHHVSFSMQYFNDVLVEVGKDE